MKPSDHPEFFRFPAPEGRSRESTIRLDREGRFFHDGALIEHAKLATALPTWIARHPDNGRFILNNGYDWTYFTVEDAPFFVLSLREDAGDAVACLSDGTEEPLDPATIRVGNEGELYMVVKANAASRERGGPFEAKLTRHAQTQLAPFVFEEGGAAFVKTKRGTSRAFA
jgi:hypothetical protein